MSEITQRKLIAALEAVFLIRLIPCEGGRSGHSVWLEDQAELNHLTGTNLSAGQKWISLVYRNIREQFEYQLGAEHRVFQYQTRGIETSSFLCRTDVIMNPKDWS